MRSIINAIVIAACLNIITTSFNDSVAGGGSSSHSNGGSHSSGSHNNGGGYSKPNNSGSTHSPRPSGSHSTPAPSSGGYSKPNSPVSNPHTPSHTHTNTTPPSHTAPAAKSVTPSTHDNHAVSKPGPTPSLVPNTALGAANNKAMSHDSLKAYQTERSSATKPPQPVHKADVKNNPARSTYQNTDQYMNKRATIINNYNNTHPGWGSMGYGMSPNYGMWSNSFLTGMIMGYVGTSLISNSMWMYSHMHEPWYPKYRADIEAQAANNADLKAKLAAMDAEVSKLKDQNAQPQQQNTLPPGVDPALAIAPEIMMIPDKHDGMSWWWGVGFFVIGLAAAGIFVKIWK